VFQKKVLKPGKAPIYAVFRELNMYYAVIMAGGSGTRLWPLSRRNYPKQALKLVGDKTMFQYAVERIRPLFPPEQIMVVTLAKHAPILMEQVPELPAQNFILEPEGRGTAPAIGLAAIHIMEKDPEACMVVLTADHFITDAKRFCDVLAGAEKVADGRLVTLGIQPSNPSTGFGYIHQAGLAGEQNGFPFYAVECFTEKPDLATARKMLESGEYSWNSGMFIWQVKRILEEFKQQMPDFNARLMEVKAALGTPDYPAVMARVWPQVNKETIDYGVMEGAGNVVVIPVDIGWTDIGSWGSLFDLLPADAHGNVFVGPHEEIDTKNTMIFGDKRLVAVMGVQDLVIVDTDDVVMICAREREQDVKALVELLKQTQQERLM
jgi:mannose-1-phosphate guanylyltransferase